VTLRHRKSVGMVSRGAHPLSAGHSLRLGCSSDADVRGVGVPSMQARAGCGRPRQRAPSDTDDA